MIVLIPLCVTSCNTPVSRPGLPPICRLVFTKLTVFLYHQITVRRGRFRDRKCYSNRTVIGSSLFRRGCDVTEIIVQDFFEFLHPYRDTMDLRNVYRRRRVDYTHCIKSF